MWLETETDWRVPGWNSPCRVYVGLGLCSEVLFNGNDKGVNVLRALGPHLGNRYAHNATFEMNQLENQAEGEGEERINGQDKLFPEAAAAAVNACVRA